MGVNMTAQVKVTTSQDASVNGRRWLTNTSEKHCYHSPDPSLRRSAGEYTYVKTLDKKNTHQYDL